MPLDQYLTLCLVCFLGAASPGPSLAVVSAAALGGGHRAGFAAAVAHGLGVALYALATVSGLSLVLAGAPYLVRALQLAGAAYLAWLGLRALRSPAGASFGSGATAVRPVRDGFLIAFLNPKLALFMLALFSQFLAADASARHRVIMVATASGIDVAWYCLVAVMLGAPGVRRRFEDAAGWVTRGFGAVLVALAVAVAVQAIV